MRASSEDESDSAGRKSDHSRTGGSARTPIRPDALAAMHVNAIVASANAALVGARDIAISFARGAWHGKCAGERDAKWIRRRFHGTLGAA
jgi:hypothetical protein